MAPAAACQIWTSSGSLHRPHQQSNPTLHNPILHNPTKWPGSTPGRFASASAWEPLRIVSMWPGHRERSHEAIESARDTHQCSAWALACPVAEVVLACLGRLRCGRSRMRILVGRRITAAHKHVDAAFDVLSRNGCDDNSSVLDKPDGAAIGTLGRSARRRRRPILDIDDRARWTGEQQRMARTAR